MRWPPYQHVFFDCDSTLTTVEGIDILAENSGKRWRVEVLTQAAMDGEKDLSEIYDQRLRAVNPTREQVLAIRQAYKKHVVEDAREVIAALLTLGHEVYIISGGLLEPVREFGVFLGVPDDHIRAVGVTYNELSGQWWVGDDEQYLTYDEGALTVSDGKAAIVRELLEGQNGRSLLIGDGHSDLLAGAAVDLFVGYAGVVKRPRVIEAAAVVLNGRSLAPLLALAAGPAALRLLTDTPFKALGDKALEQIEAGAIKFNNDHLGNKFNKAIDAAHQALYPRTD
jgi:phosphoserine phosphatase